MTPLDHPVSPRSPRPAQAYQAAAATRSMRDQEADVFRRATGALRAGRTRPGPSRVRAVADNRRLWIAVSDLMTDPHNQLPLDLRANFISLSLAVRKEMEKPDPDLDFLIAINETIIAGLAGQA